MSPENEWEVISTTTGSARKPRTLTCKRRKTSVERNDYYLADRQRPKLAVLRCRENSIAVCRP